MRPVAPAIAASASVKWASLTAVITRADGRQERPCFFCAHCNLVDAETCAICGKTLELRTDYYKPCRVCSGPVHIEARFCQMCGSSRVPPP